VDELVVLSLSPVGWRKREYFEGGRLIIRETDCGLSK